ncbi:YlxQ family RNA-binding protein [Caldalkalibacillus mannanilyticus]|uniref:YlxQ family RNA-binding protein n=1 Tax=Caldalkalibacillus mannanilyticus TaxID=1418 RepID=UPI00046AC327|nr:YlxQ family RNA-binding protein [Caldalkalibacillus mannanilyticus]
MNPKLYQMLGMAMRARKLIAGEELVISAIRQKKVHLVFISQDASDNTMKKVKDKSTYYKVALITVDSREELGQAIGKDQRVVVGVIDQGFAKQMIALHQL